MPLITITCQEEWHPSSRDAHLVWRLARDLPELVTDHREGLWLDEGTPTEGVQVEIERFSEWSINAPDVWILMALTEDPSGVPEQDRRLARDAFVALIQRWIEKNCDSGRPSLAIDTFWGPGYGCMIDKKGKITLTW